MKTNYKILIEGNNRTFFELSQQLNVNNFNAVETSSEALDILYYAMREKPSACILNTSTDLSDSLIDNLCKINPKPLVYIFLSPETSINRKLFRERQNIKVIDYYIPPADFIKKLNTDLHFHNLNCHQSDNICQLHNYVSEILSKLCITPNYNGFILLRESIKMAAVEPLNARSFSKIVYPKLSSMYVTSTASIERNIRTVIIKGWEKSSLADRCAIFGATACDPDWTPTNGEVILIIADKVARDLGLISVELQA